MSRSSTTKLSMIYIVAREMNVRAQLRRVSRSSLFLISPPTGDGAPRKRARAVKLPRSLRKLIKSYCTALACDAAARSATATLETARETSAPSCGRTPQMDDAGLPLVVPLRGQLRHYLR